jgi:uncharacterized protein YwqG
MTVPLAQYAQQKRDEAGESVIPSGIRKRWRERIVANGWQEMGEAGATKYLDRYGQNVGAPKVIQFARQAEAEGCPEVAQGFWRKAYELERGHAPPPKLGLYLENLPAELAESFQAELGPFQGNIEATIRPYVKIGNQPEDRVLPWHSKFGGYPYLPQGTPYPTTPAGRPLFLLAQINFAQVPRVEPFPQEGILQFYIVDDGLYGVNYHDPTIQEGFRVLYFQVVEDEKELVTDLGSLPERADFPFSKPRSLTFERKYAPISGNDYRFTSAVFGQDIFHPEEKLQEIQRLYERIISSYGDKMGGYPCFRQWDPRRKAYKEYEILLLQLFCGAWSSDHGALSFFIREKDLRERDFSRVMYHWDVD